MADIAAAFGWAPPAMDPMSLDELMRWWKKAVKRRIKPVAWVQGEE